MKRLQDPARAAREKRQSRKLTPGAYADDIQATGPLQLGLAAIQLVKEKGPAFGIRLNTAKTKIVVKHRDLTAAQQILATSSVPEVQVVLSARNLGGVIGSEQAKLEFQKDNANRWAEEVKKLARIAPDNPQAVYTAFTLSQKAKWQYQQRVCKCENAEEVYGVIEQAIRDCMIPRLTGWNNTSPAERQMLALPVRHGGMAIDSPVQSAGENYKASIEATAVFQSLIIEGSDMQVEDIHAHNKQFVGTTSQHKSERRERHQKEATALATNKNPHKLPPDRVRAFNRAREENTGYFLLARPLESVGFRLTKDEWYDGISAHYNSTLISAPTFCDGHPLVRYTLEHALTCPKGSNRIHRHDTIKNALQMVAHKAVGASIFHVEREPWLIRQGAKDERGRVCKDGLRGDLKIRGMHGFTA